MTQLTSQQNPGAQSTSASSPSVTRILLVDDHPLLRKGVAQLIELEDSLQVCAEADNGSQAIQLALRHAPDLILLDLNMHGMSGLETLKALRQAEICARIVVFTVSNNNADVIASLKAGADGYILKDCEPELLLDYIQQAAFGKMVVSESLTQVLAQALRGEKTQKPNPLNSLTEREKETLKLIASGDSNKLIARQLNITEGTVKVHVKHLLKKLGLRSRVEAAVWAVENNIK